MDCWGEGGAFRHNIADPALRSVAVSAIETGPDEARQLRHWTECVGGLTLGIGLGFGQPGSPEWDCHFRIGHMGHQNVPMVMGVIGTMDAGMKACGIPHGDGASAAAAQVLAEAV